MQPKVSNARTIHHKQIIFIHGFKLSHIGQSEFEHAILVSFIHKEQFANK